MPDSNSGAREAASPDRSALVVAALGLRGTPYRNGGSDPGGFDCSGFTQFVFGRYGVRLPREVEEQFRIGKSIPRSKARQGDLVFFTTTTRGASHVGIVVDSDTFVHAPNSTGVVRIERLSADYWTRRVVGFRRLLSS